MSVADALTKTPSTAELWVAYFRKSLISLIPIFTAGVLVISSAVNSGHALDGVTWWSVATAVAQAVLTYAPSNAIAKALASVVLALGAVVAAALTHGGISAAEGLLILVQFLAWATATIVPNGAHPAIAATSRKVGLPE
jgi:hypothetical protein